MFTNRLAVLLAILATVLIFAGSVSGCAVVEQFDAYKRCDGEKWMGWEHQKWCNERIARGIASGEYRAAAK